MIKGTLTKATFEYGGKTYEAKLEEVKYAADIINGILSQIREKGWEQGYRNCYAVNFSIAAFVLGEKGEELFDKIVNDTSLFGDLLDGPDSQYKYASDRVAKVDEYLETWMKLTIAHDPTLPYTTLIDVYGINAQDFADIAKKKNLNHPIMVLGTEDIILFQE